MLRGYHLMRIDGMETHSVLMEREKSHTKSVIQAEVTGRELTLKYIPEVLEKSPAAPLAYAHVETIPLVRNKQDQESGR